MEKLLLIIKYYFVVLIAMYVVAAPSCMFITASISMWNPFEWEMVGRIIFVVFHLVIWLTLLLYDITLIKQD